VIYLTFFPKQNIIWGYLKLRKYP